MEEEIGPKKPCSIQLSIVSTQENIEETLGVVAILTLFSFYFSLMISTSIIYVGEARLNSWKKRVTPCFAPPQNS